MSAPVGTPERLVSDHAEDVAVWKGIFVTVGCLVGMMFGIIYAANIIA